MLRSSGAVLGSYLLSIVLVLATDPLLSRVFPGEFAKGHIPSSAGLTTSTVLFIVISVLCAWLCARLAPRSKGRHVVAFFILGEVFGVAATIANWSSGWPHWYPLAWLFSWPVSCWIGYRLARSAREGVPTGVPAAR
jgi:hypothetical protein